MFIKLNLSILFISFIIGYVLFNIFFNVFMYEKFTNSNTPLVRNVDVGNAQARIQQAKDLNARNMQRSQDIMNDMNKENNDDEENSDNKDEDEEEEEGYNDEGDDDESEDENEEESDNDNNKKKKNKNNIQTREIYAITDNKIYNSSIPCGINKTESVDCSWNNINTDKFTPTKVYQGKNDIWAIDNLSDKKKTSIYRCNKPCIDKWESIPILNNGIITDLYIDNNKNNVYGIDSKNKIHKCNNTLDATKISSCTKNNNWGLSNSTEKVTITNYVKANPTRKILFNPNSDKSGEIYAVSDNKIYKYSLSCGITNKGGDECRWDKIDTNNFTPAKVYQGKDNILAISNVSDKKNPDMYICKKPCGGNWKKYDSNTIMDIINKVPIREIIFNFNNYLMGWGKIKSNI